MCISPISASFVIPFWHEGLKVTGRGHRLSLGRTASLRPSERCPEGDDKMMVLKGWIKVEVRKEENMVSLVRRRERIRVDKEKEERVREKVWWRDKSLERKGVTRRERKVKINRKRKIMRRRKHRMQLESNSIHKN